MKTSILFVAAVLWMLWPQATSTQDTNPQMLAAPSSPAPQGPRPRVTEGNNGAAVIKHDRHFMAVPIQQKTDLQPVATYSANRVRHATSHQRTTGMSILMHANWQMDAKTPSQRLRGRYKFRSRLQWKTVRGFCSVSMCRA